MDLPSFTPILDQNCEFDCEFLAGFFRPFQTKSGTSLPEGCRDMLLGSP